MLKKLTIFCVIFVLLFSVVGLAACNNDDELADYKTQAIASLEAYAESKGQDNYTTENWETIKTIVENGKTTINASESKETVDTAKAEAMSEIDGVRKEWEIMTFNAVMYGNPHTVKTWLHDDFYEEFLTFGAWSYIQESYIEDEKLPKERILIINSQEKFELVFKEFPLEVDFNSKIIIMYGITTASGSEIVLKDVIIGESLVIKYGFPIISNKKPHPPDASKPLTKWAVVLMDKVDITSVIFEQ
ncbi:MAG: hypothetical protein WC292_03835 [Clostridia bacterium]